VSRGPLKLGPRGVRPDWLTLAMGRQRRPGRMWKRTMAAPARAHPGKFQTPQWRSAPAEGARRGDSDGVPTSGTWPGTTASPGRSGRLSVNSVEFQPPTASRLAHSTQRQGPTCGTLPAGKLLPGHWQPARCGPRSRVCGFGHAVMSVAFVRTAPQWPPPTRTGTRTVAGTLRAGCPKPEYDRRANERARCEPGPGQLGGATKIHARDGPHQRTEGD